MRGHRLVAIGSRVAMVAVMLGGLLLAGVSCRTAPAERFSEVPAAVTRTNVLLGGTQFATPYFVHDSGVPGPAVMVLSGAHGDEVAGPAAAERLRHWPLKCGRMLVVPRANVPALEVRRRLTPLVDTNLSNLNRNYPRAGEPGEARGALATAIWDAALQFRPDWVLDLHEGFDFHRRNSNSVGSSVIAFPVGPGPAAADLMVAAVNASITNVEQQFVRLRMPVNGSLARAAGEHLQVPGMTLETTTRLPLAARVWQHEVMVHRLMTHLNMTSVAVPAAPALPVAVASTPVPPPAATASARVRVALYHGPGASGAGPGRILQQLTRPPETSIRQVTPEEIRSGALADFDVVIFPGGTAGGQARALGEAGIEAVRRFVGAGGGYVGICAGAYLATSGASNRLNIINARTKSSKWQRGTGTVMMEQTDAGREILPRREGSFEVRYVNGPVVEPASIPALAPYETLAWFRTELAENDVPRGIMVDSPAIFAGSYLQGRVVCISPHPEQTAGLEEFVPRVVEWVRGGG